jgi:hypothetical protein
MTLSDRLVNVLHIGNEIWYNCDGRNIKPDEFFTDPPRGDVIRLRMMNFSKYWYDVKNDRAKPHGHSPTILNFDVVKRGNRYYHIDRQESGLLVFGGYTETHNRTAANKGAEDRVNNQPSKSSDSAEPAIDFPLIIEYARQVNATT